MLEAIKNRRSIRKFKEEEVPRYMIEEIIQSGVLAPSAKNRQPWKFVVVSGNAKADMVSAMGNGLERERERPLLPNVSQYISGASYTLKIMEKAPVTIFIVNPVGVDIHSSLTEEEHIEELCNAQSIGAAIENMILTATELGLGSLWICDTYFAYDELQTYLNTEGELIAALTIGYADEAPNARPRKSMDEVVEWRD
ncbi:nitroreductase family protein [Lacrimispora aerotolerans]|uniref:nitroreductase family protein n=1 Tax=Lacrimispora aerotolerans TaxID=36832 RepID=UPI00047BC4B9|nr:nitroreductase family protein [Lacrimispora aerotolerans]